MYHARILALGVVPTLGLVATFYALMLLPWWAAVIPPGLFAAYCFGRLIELWAMR